MYAPPAVFSLCFPCPLPQVQREQLRCREDSLRLRRSLGCAERDLAQAQNRVRLLQVPDWDRLGSAPGLIPAWGGVGAWTGMDWAHSTLGRCLYWEVVVPILGLIPAWGDAGACTGLSCGVYSSLGRCWCMYWVQFRGVSHLGRCWCLYWVVLGSVLGLIPVWGGAGACTGMYWDQF